MAAEVATMGIVIGASVEQGTHWEGPVFFDLRNIL